MSKIRSINDLQDALDRERIWRIKELHALRSQLSRVEGYSKKSMLRANIAILYAHWEGFVKKAALIYIEYVSRQGCRVGELSDCFALLALRRQLNEVSTTKSAEAGLVALQFVRHSLEEIHTVSFDGSIRTESNLSSDVFLNILRSLGFSTERYAPYENLIDVQLLKNRNKVAHGEYVDLMEDDFIKIDKKVMMLIDWFKTDIENAATLRQFLLNP